MHIHDWIKKRLTKTVTVQAGEQKKTRKIDVPPSQKTVFAVEISIIAIILLAMLEIVHIIVLRSWNEGLFAAMMGFIGNVVGILLGRE
jgi:hypothetical protein